MTERGNGCLAGRQAMLREQFRNGAIRRSPLPQLSNDILRREQVLELLWPESAHTGIGTAVIRALKRSA